jgi:hypothetical protein
LSHTRLLQRQQRHIKLRRDPRSILFTALSFQYGKQESWAERKGQQTKDGTTLKLTIFALTVKRNKACRQGNRL